MCIALRVLGLNALNLSAKTTNRTATAWGMTQTKSDIEIDEQS